MLAVNANQSTLRAEVNACFAAAPPGTVTPHAGHDKGHGRKDKHSIRLRRKLAT